MSKITLPPTNKSSASKQSMNIFTILAVVVVAVIIALLLVDLIVSVILFVISTIGILISMAMTKPELTPEDELRKSTIEQYQVPETRGALLKFAIEATQQIHTVSPIAKIFSMDAKRQLWLNDIWATKCKKVYTTARFAMKDDTKSLSEITQLITAAGVKI